MTQTHATQEAIEAAGFDFEEYAGHVRALCEHLDCEPDDLRENSYDQYGLLSVEYGRQTYLVGTDEEADAAIVEYCKDSIWAFNADFLCEVCGLPSELADCLKGYQEAECEGANDALLALVEKCSDLDTFARKAASADGRGHFLSGYDGNEHEITAEDAEGERVTYYVYQN